MVWPPAPCAPREAARMTPPRPPVTTVAPPRASSLADLLGPFEDAVRVGSARIAVADHRHVGRSGHRAIGRSDTGRRSPSWTVASVSYLAGPVPRWLRMSSTPRPPADRPAPMRLARCQRRRSTGSPPCPRQGQVRAEWRGAIAAQARAATAAATGGEPAIGIRDAVPEDPALPAHGKAPSPPVADVARLVRRRPRAACRLRSAGESRLGRSSRGRQGSGATHPDRSSAAHRPAAAFATPQRRRDRSSSQRSHRCGTATKQRQPLVDHRPCRRASTIGSSSSSESDDLHAVRAVSGRWRCVRSIRTPLDPDGPRALDIGVDVVSHVDRALGAEPRPGRAPTGRFAGAASRSRCGSWRR